MYQETLLPFKQQNWCHKTLQILSQPISVLIKSNQKRKRKGENRFHGTQFCIILTSQYLHHNNHYAYEFIMMDINEVMRLKVFKIMRTEEIMRIIKK